MHLCSIDWWFHLPFIYVHCTRYSSGCSLIQGIYAQLTGGVHLPSIYMHCTRSSSGCSGMQGICAWLTGGFIFHQGIYAWLTGGVHLPSVYMHCTRYSSWCSLIQGIHAWLTGGIICLLYICIVLDIVVDVPYSRHPCLIDWWFHLPSIYMHCTSSSSGCNGMQGICAQFTGESNSSSGCSSVKVSMLNWLGVYLPSIYMHCTRSSSGCSVYKASMLNWLGVFICLQYIGIVLDVAVGVVVCKASVLKW